MTREAEVAEENTLELLERDADSFLMLSFELTQVLPVVRRAARAREAPLGPALEDGADPPIALEDAPPLELQDAPPLAALVLDGVAGEEDEFADMYMEELQADEGVVGEYNRRKAKAALVHNDFFNEFETVASVCFSSHLNNNVCESF